MPITLRCRYQAPAAERTPPEAGMVLRAEKNRGALEAGSQETAPDGRSTDNSDGNCRAVLVTECGKACLRELAPTRRVEPFGGMKRHASSFVPLPHRSRTSNNSRRPISHVPRSGNKRSKGRRGSTQ
jgi:hypothetical protein